MLYVHQGRACINAGSPIASLVEAREYVESCIARIRRNGLVSDGATWSITDETGHVVEQIIESFETAA